MKGAERFGRYEIVGRIATGGMAEVSLARLRGPEGFERPVVIKRILPHLALDRRFVDMFLDEARLIASLCHPNLVPVHELVRDEDELFMVMEFLEGESVAGICRRLAARDRQLDYELAAHVVSEACAGLHAAHEATSRDGRSLGIVHRDVSPQNIIVTYSGAVYVIDFGIATSADRVSRTETGTVRGKTEYLAPEQIKAEPLDRRVDVFGLGIVLFELASGRRLYKRPSAAAAMMAILSEPAPKLSALRPGAPEELDAIAGRALAKDKNDRFATVADLRRALLPFMHSRSSEDLGERLAALMRELFTERATEKTELLRAVSRGDEVETMPAAEVDEGFELPTAADAAPTPESADMPPPTPPRPRKGWLAIAGAVLVVTLAVFFVSRLQRSANASPQANSAVVPVARTAESQRAARSTAEPIAAPTLAPSASDAGSPARSTAKIPKPARTRAAKPAPSVW